MADYIVTGNPHDTVFLVTPQNEVAMEHFRTYVEESAQWLGLSVGVEHRYIESIINHLRDDGFVVQDIDGEEF